MRANPGFAILLFAFGILTGGPSARPVHADSVEPFPAPGAWVRLETREGVRVDARLLAVDADSVRVGRGDEMTSYSTDALTAAWKRKSGAVDGLKAGLVFGTAVGLLEGFTVPGNCIDCEEERGSAEAVLGAVAGEALFFGLAGLVVGALGGRWQPVDVPGPGAFSPQTPLFPQYGASLGVGITSGLENEGTTWGAALGGWRNSGPKRSWGMEFGVLQFAQREEYNYEWSGVGVDSIVYSRPGTSRRILDEGWAYFLPLVFRMRGGEGTVRGFGELGAGAYAEKVAYDVVVRDSTGAVVRHDSGSDLDAGLGLSGGGGVSFGRGELRPALRARAHWVISGQDPGFAVTGHLGLEFR